MKFTSAICQMSYRSVPDSLDEYLKMGATTTRKSLQMFCKAIMKLYGEGFLRKPRYTDIENFMLITRKSIAGKGPDVPFVANNVTKRGYYLTDGIYPEWSVLIKSISNPGANDHKRILYKMKHKATRKDMKRAFGVLKK
ncbi:ALP1-like protein [Tanacetum coccineum]|uniref:ALP1-like protein n=1 Tax=Tanacetum coccineum TaxID=301880 RepID=A0ABQ5I9N5_9ASTR